MALNDRFRHDKGEIKRFTGCLICGAEYEDLRHFLLNCEKLEGDRDRKMIEELRGRDDKETLCNLLFRGGRMGEVGEMIQKMWGTRKYWMNRLGLGGRGNSTS